ncbi:MAG: GGDEF domain-containing protein, partial [bacterium]|nr:GGDEF domain-containing protein [bacterium]
RKPKNRYFVFIKDPEEKNKGLIIQNEQLKNLSTTDDLTGLLNRRGFDGYMNQVMDKKDRDIAIIMIDIDHFKQYNDEHGHAKGDEVLKEVAGGIKEVSRTGDVCARYGGEEFAIMIPRPPKDIELFKIANRYVEYFRDHGNGITISLGATKYYDSLDIGMWKKTMRRADQALYQAKAKGRNTSEFIDYFEAKDLVESVIEFKNE